MNLRTRAAFAILGLALITGAIGPVGAADPASGSLRAPGDSVEWNGGPFVASAPTSQAANVEPCSSPSDPSCDRFSVDVAAQTGPSTLSITCKQIHAQNAEGGAGRGAAQASLAKVSTISRATSSRYCTGGDFMK